MENDGDNRDRTTPIDHVDTQQEPEAEVKNMRKALILAELDRAGNAGATRREIAKSTGIRLDGVGPILTKAHQNNEIRRSKEKRAVTGEKLEKVYLSKAHWDDEKHKDELSKAHRGCGQIVDPTTKVDEQEGGE